MMSWLAAISRGKASGSSERRLEKLAEVPMAQALISKTDPGYRPKIAFHASTEIAASNSV